MTDAEPNPFEPSAPDPARMPWIILRCDRCSGEVGRVKFLAPNTAPMTCLRCLANEGGSP